MPTALSLSALSFVAVLAALPAHGAHADERAPLRVLAAASLADAVADAARDWNGARVEASFGASSALARQVRDGAPGDVFLSASRAWMDFLRDAGALEGEPVVVARNRLVCIAPRGRGEALAGAGVAGPRALAGALDDDARIAIADEGVPAGEYARAALASSGADEALRGRLVGQRDVRAVLYAVEAGEVDAGFVYATDARVAGVDVVFAFDPATHPPIEYLAAALRGARAPAEARRFLDHLRSEAVRARLAAAGFALP